MLKRRILNIFKYLLFLGLGVFLVWWSFSQIPDEKWADFKKAFSTARYWLIGPVFFILMISHLLRSYRWKILMQPLGYNPSFANTFFAVMIGYFANLAIPRLGEVLKCTILAKYEKIPADKLVGTIVAERAFDVVSLLICFILALLVQYEIIADYGSKTISQLLRGKGDSISWELLIYISIIVVAVILVLRFVFKKFQHIKLVQLIRKTAKGILEGILSVRHVKNKTAFFASSIGIWAMYLIGTWVGFYGTLGTSGLSINVAVSSLAFASIGMIITPGGIGAYALFMANILVLNGIPFELGFANGTLQWFAQFLIIIIMGFISLTLLPYYNKKKTVNEKSRPDTQ
ncbi:MAG: hypothetical protein JWQ96_2101 [Segetibacter sp.]|nr:hypothetical protein [Segetibacter sp.]